MLRKNYGMVALSIFLMPMVAASLALAAGAGSPPAPGAVPSPARAVQTTSPPLPVTQTPPSVSVPASEANQFEHHSSVQSLPGVFAHQWSLVQEIAPEGIINERYLRTRDTEIRRLSLKQAIYIALVNNPGLKAVQLNPVAAQEAVRIANGAFDPDLTSEGDIEKNVTPVSSIFQTLGKTGFAQKFYDWNFGVNKLLSLTNGTLSLAFDNQRALSNSGFSSVNPAYNPTLTLSLAQPLLRNFGWEFATINVQLAESAQKQAQWGYGQQLLDFVQRIGNEYWSVVAAEENLQVAQEALRFNSDLVRVNRISVQVGTLAPIDLQEAQSAEATAIANVAAAEATLRNARAVLRQDIMLNPAHTFVPEDIEPSDRPNPVIKSGLQPWSAMTETEEAALELAVQYRPSLAQMREAIRTALLQVRFAENQTLPQLNLGAEIGATATSGTTPCLSAFNPIHGNCTPKGKTILTGEKLPFGGVYGDALNRMFNFSFYNYAAVINFEFPLDNAAAKAALGQARATYEQSRLQYRAALSQAIAEVESALSNARADVQRVNATRAAAYYALQSLHDEQVRFRVGMATTHDLLQFQSELVSAEGNQVSAAVDLENARLALWHAEGTLMQKFQIDFQLQNPHETPWYARF
jgi:outer membrane protein